MKLIINNQIVIENPSADVKDYCRNNLIIDNPDYLLAERMGRYLGNIEREIYLYSMNGDSYILPFGCLTDVWKLSKGCEYENKIHTFIGNNLVGNINLYDYQQNALNRLILGKNGVLEAPCGSGKTQIGLALIKKLGGRALWLTHTHKLLEQSLDRAKALFSKGDYGTITKGKICMGKDITFATVQTMREIDPLLYRNAFDIIVVDECHHCVGTPTKVHQFYKVVNNCNARYKYGLSATLTRADNMINCVYAILGKKLHSITEQEVGNKIIKAKHTKVEIDLDYDLMDYCEGDGTINYNSLINMLSNDPRRNQVILDYVNGNYEQGKKQMILCHRVSQVEQLARDIQDMGISVSAISGKVKDAKRNYDADVIIATYSLAKEGLDIPDLDVVHFATPQKDKAIVKQSAGRVERNIVGKEQPIVYDYVDNKIGYCQMCYKKRRAILK